MIILIPTYYYHYRRATKVSSLAHSSPSLRATILGRAASPPAPSSSPQFTNPCATILGQAASPQRRHRHYSSPSPHYYFPRRPPPITARTTILELSRLSSPPVPSSSPHTITHHHHLSQPSSSPHTIIGRTTILGSLHHPMPSSSPSVVFICEEREEMRTKK